MISFFLLKITLQMALSSVEFKPGKNQSSATFVSHIQNSIFANKPMIIDYYSCTGAIWVILITVSETKFNGSQSVY